MYEINSDWKITHKAVGVATSLLLIYSVISMALLIIDGQLANATDSIVSQREDQLVALLRMDYLATPLYYLLFFGLFTTLKKSNNVPAIVASLLGFVGVTIFLIMPSNFSWIILNGNFTSDSIDAQKSLLQAANGAVTASDLWKGTGSLLGKILIQISLFLISFIMLRSNVFRADTAWVGIAAHGLDLLHILVGYSLPTGGFSLMIVAGPLSLVWFLLLAQDFFRLGSEPTANPDYLGMNSIS